VAFVALYDANVLYPSTIRDVLIRMAQMGLFQARWSAMILDEVFRNLKQNRPELDSTRLDRTRSLMIEAVPDCLVEGFEPLIEALVLPDADDRHVLAAAISGKAQLIVTANTKHFPSDELDKYGIEAKHPDAFLQDLIEFAGPQVYQAVTETAAACRNPPLTVSDIIDRLDRDGVPVSASLLRH
jgi:predicted nucleic acid-binding protein